MKKIELSLEEHQKFLYEILYVIDDFCKKHDIQYLLHGGTLLGAARHGGIIPWDDDVDIALTRPNYEKFVRLFRQEAPKGYLIHDFETEDWYDYPFAKIEKEGTFFRKGYFNQPPMGIFVDVFIIDGCGNNKFEAVNYYMSRCLPIYDTQFWFNGNPAVNFNMWKSKLVYYFKLRPLMAITFIKKWYLRQIYKKAEYYSFEDSLFCGNIVCGHVPGEVQPKECFTNLIKMQFGERELPVPQMYDDYLTGMYGDWRTPLPPEKRTHHGEGVSYLLVED